MAKAKSKAKKTVQSQAIRILEAKKSGTSRAERNFAETMGRITLARQGRKAVKMG